MLKPDFWTVRGIAELVGVGERTVLGWIKNGILPATEQLYNGKPMLTIADADFQQLIEDESRLA